MRYAREEKYAGNKNEIKECDIVFIAVLTPTAPEGLEVLTPIESKNINLLKSSGKDIDLFYDIYDKETVGKV